MINSSLIILALLLVSIEARKNVLLSAAHYFTSHQVSMSIIAEKICNDSELNCIIVAEQGSKSKWTNVKGQVLYLSDSENTEKMKILTELLQNNTEDGVLLGAPVLRKIMDASITYWYKDKIFEKLDQIGIDITFCDIGNFGCLVAAHKLNINTNVYYSAFCNPWSFAGSHEGDWNSIPCSGFAGLSEKMTFIQRLVNLFLTKSIGILGSIFFYGDIGNIHVPSISSNDWRSNTLIKHGGLFILPCIPSFSYSQYLPSNFMHLGPVVNRKVNPLADNFLQFIDLFSKIIYISFGTSKINFNYQLFVNVAHMMPEIGFIISYRKADSLDKTHLPLNCLILSWVNQTDLLGSGKVDAFVTHCGWNSVSESLLHGVPMIALGFSEDQIDTAILVHKRKVGRAIVDKSKFSVENIFDEINEVLNNKTYKQNTVKYSKMINKWDSEGKIVEAIKAFSEVGFEKLIVEAEHTMSWVEYWKVDIYCFLGLIGICIVFGAFKCFKIMFRKIWSYSWKVKVA